MVLLASGVQMQLQVASPKVREKGRGRVRKWAQTQGVLKRAEGLGGCGDTLFRQGVSSGGVLRL